MRSGQQRATAADDLDETMTARHDSSLDNVEHSSSLSRRAITPQYADALMCSHDLTGANALLPSKEAGNSGTSVMRADLAAATSTSFDVHEAQWRSGANRQARPDAVSHQHAASQAAARKRSANAIPETERKAKRAAAARKAYAKGAAARDHEKFTVKYFGVMDQFNAQMLAATVDDISVAVRIIRLGCTV